MSYLELLTKLMNDRDLSLGQALDLDIERNGIDELNVFDVTDYLEIRCQKDMDIVSFLSSVYFGQETDYALE